MYKTKLDRTLRVIKERDVGLQGLMLASMISSLDRLGLLTQGTVAALAGDFTPKLCAYFIHKGIIKKDMNVKDILDTMFRSFGYKYGEYKIETKDNEVLVNIVTDKCKVCPKGVGGAEIPGTACPLPYMISVCLSLLTDKLWMPKVYGKGAKKEVLRKEEGTCKMKIALTNQA